MHHSCNNEPGRPFEAMLKWMIFLQCTSIKHKGFLKAYTCPIIFCLFKAKFLNITALKCAWS
jgi:hypothetical protein